MGAHVIGQGLQLFQPGFIDLPLCKFLQGRVWVVDGLGDCRPPAPLAAQPRSDFFNVHGLIKAKFGYVVKPHLANSYSYHWLGTKQRQGGRDGEVNQPTTIQTGGGYG